MAYPDERVVKPKGPPKKSGNRDNTRPPHSQGGKPGDPVPGSKQGADKELKNWLKRMEQRALAGGLLSGPGVEGAGSTELIDLLHSNPELAANVQKWIQQQKTANDGTLPGLAGAGGLQTQLFQQFPELYQQYVAATGKSIIYDAAGNPVRVVDPNSHYGLREGDTVVAPKLYNRKGEEVPLPEIGGEGDGGPAAATGPSWLGGFDILTDDDLNQLGGAAAELIRSRQRRNAATTYYNDPFPAESFGSEA